MAFSLFWRGIWGVGAGRVGLRYGYQLGRIGASEGRFGGSLGQSRPEASKGTASELGNAASCFVNLILPFEVPLNNQGIHRHTPCIEDGKRVLIFIVQKMRKR